MQSLGSIIKTKTPFLPISIDLNAAWAIKKRQVQMKTIYSLSMMITLLLQKVLKYFLPKGSDDSFQIKRSNHQRSVESFLFQSKYEGMLTPDSSLIWKLNP